MVGSSIPGLNWQRFSATLRAVCRWSSPRISVPVDTSVRDKAGGEERLGVNLRFRQTQVTSRARQKGLNHLVSYLS